MIVTIQHEIALSYSSSISESVIDLRLTPRTDGHQTLRKFNLSIDPDVPAFDHFDWQDNRVHQLSIVGRHDRSVIVTKCTIEIHPQRWRLEHYNDLRPVLAFDRRYQDFLRPHGPVQFDSRLERLASEVCPGRESRVTLALTAVMTRLQALVKFNQGAAATSAASVSDVLTRGEGNAQDYAHVALSMLRQLGVPARYVSGYLFRHGTLNVDCHAWIEALVPSAGWIGIDPTLGQLVGTGHIALATGRSELDALSRRGVFRGDAQQAVEHSLHRVDIQLDRRDHWSWTPQFDNRILIESMLRDQMWTKASIEQQSLQ
jgi:transglutaminase-like putative cysteine protease